MAVTNRIDFGQVTKGGPADPAVAAVVAKPDAPFFNETTDAAKKATVIGSPPNREDNFSHPNGVPADFFS